MFDLIECSVIKCIIVKVVNIKGNKKCNVKNLFNVVLDILNLFLFLIFI